MDTSDFRDTHFGEGGGLFAIGDIHGCAAELRLLLNKLPITPHSTVVFLGDYIDRGHQSREVIDTILELRHHCQVVTLMGNHEAVFLEYLRDPASEVAGMFIYNGGSATLASYSDRQGNVSMPKEHRDFFLNLDLYWRWENYMFVHAGVPDIPYVDFERVGYHEDLLWRRSTGEPRQHAWPFCVVHGHTPQRRVTVSDEDINLDTGCVYNRILTAMEFPSRQVYSVRRMSHTRHVFLRDRNPKRAAARFQGQLPVYVDEGEVMLEFETLNYNEFGMLIRSVSHPDRMFFDLHEPLQGRIGSAEYLTVYFEGEVVRVEEEDGEFRYGIKMLAPVGQMEFEKAL